MAGLGVELGEHFALDLGYRYMYMFSPEFDVISDFAPVAHLVGQVRLLLCAAAELVHLALDLCKPFVRRHIPVAAENYNGIIFTVFNALCLTDHVVTEAAIPFYICIFEYAFKL